MGTYVDMSEINLGQISCNAKWLDLVKMFPSKNFPLYSSFKPDKEYIVHHLPGGVGEETLNVRLFIELHALGSVVML